MEKHLKFLCQSIAAILTITFANTASAANFWWTGKDSRDYGTKENWSSKNDGSTVATAIPGSDAVRFMANNGSTSVFSDRFKNDGYIVEFDNAYTTGYQLFFNTDGMKVIFTGTGENASLTYTRGGYSTGAVMGIGDVTDSYLRIEDMVYTHSYTNLVLGWTNGKKGNLEIGSGAMVNIPSTAGWCDGLWMRYGSSMIIDGGTLDCAKNIRIGVANSGLEGINVVSNINGTITAKWFGVGCKNTHGQYIQKGGALATTDHIFLAHDWTHGSGYFEVDGGEVTAGATSNMNIYVGHKGYSESSAHFVVKGNSEVNCNNLLIGEKSPGVVDIEGGLVRALNECRLSSDASSGDDDALEHPVLNLLGGVLETPRVKCASTNAYATVFFNGGTLREHTENDTIIKNESRLYVKVGAKGGTIDTNGLTTRLPKTIETGVDEGVDGGMMFMGGGTLALQNSASLSYAGDTRVVLGTTLSVPVKNKINFNKFVCLVDTKPTEEWSVLLTITGNDVLNANDLAKVRIVDGKYSATSVRLKLSNDGKSILCKKTNGFIISFY